MKNLNCCCGEKAIYWRRYSGQRFCRDCFNQYFERRVLETIRKYRMTRKGERIGVGISGGKDSTTLLHVLNKLKPKLGISLHPILIDEGILGYRKSGIETAKNTCMAVGLELLTASFNKETGHTLDELQRTGEQKPCTYCGVLRRKLLNQTAIEGDLDKLATGHNLDDEAQVVMMNYLSGDIERLHRLMGNAANPDMIKRIKPLSLIPEKEVMIYALNNNLRTSADECPYAKHNHRTKVREFLNTLETDQPGVKFSIISGWEKLINSMPPRGTNILACKVCKAPTARDKCRACELKEEIKIKMSAANMGLAD